MYVTVGEGYGEGERSNRTVYTKTSEYTLFTRLDVTSIEWTINNNRTTLLRKGLQQLHNSKQII